MNVTPYQFLIGVFEMSGWNRNVDHVYLSNVLLKGISTMTLVYWIPFTVTESELLKLDGMDGT